MKFLTFFLLFFISSWAQAFQGTQGVELEVGECTNKSKGKYLVSNHTEPYPKTKSFQCFYRCRHSEGEQGEVVLMEEIDVHVGNADNEGLRAVCPGIFMKRTGNIYDIDETKPMKFYAYGKMLPVLRHNIPRNKEIEKAKINILKKELEKAIQSYSGPYNPYFFSKAGEYLKAIADELPENQDLLLKRIELIKKSSSREPDSESLVVSNLERYVIRPYKEHLSDISSIGEEGLNGIKEKLLAAVKVFNEKEYLPSYFKEASQVLQSIAKELPTKQDLLQNKIESIKMKKRERRAYSTPTPEFVVETILRTRATWLF